MIIAVTVMGKTKRKKEGQDGELKKFHAVDFLLLAGELCFDSAFKGLFSFYQYFFLSFAKLKHVLTRYLTLASTPALALSLISACQNKPI